MFLSDLIKALKNCTIDVQYTGNGFDDINISNVTSNSKYTGSNIAFVCIKGAGFDGHDFINEAYERGSRVFFVEQGRKISFINHDSVMIHVPNTNKAFNQICSSLYNPQNNGLYLIGITGTKGKTTTALMIKKILDNAGLSTGYIGTNGIMYNSIAVQTINTTPDFQTICKHLKDMKNAGVKYVVIEASSQGLWKHRLDGLDFKICVFTNIFRDHIGQNEHPDFQHYFDSKAKLFKDFSPQYIVYNNDDRIFLPVFDNCAGSILLPFSIKKKIGLYADRINNYKNDSCLGVSFNCNISSVNENNRCSRTNNIEFTLPMAGQFNVYNALAAIQVCNILGVPIEFIRNTLSQIYIDGRFECVNLNSEATFIIDYAHNGASLQAVLDTLKEYRHNRIICVFGSVGGRTKDRRYELGAVAARNADFSILTADNPDHELVSIITHDIAKAFTDCGLDDKFTEIFDRKEAIATAYRMAKKDDIVLLAGKGHEKYQLIDEKRLYFSEREILIELDKEKSSVPIV